MSPPGAWTCRNRQDLPARPARGRGDLHPSKRTHGEAERGENAIILSPQEARRSNYVTADVNRGRVARRSGHEDIRHRQREWKSTSSSVDRRQDWEDLLEWARRLLETEEPEVLVSRLLEKVDSRRPTGYALKEELRREQAHRSSQRERTPKADDREARVKSRGPATPVRMALKSSREWNVGRVLSGICNALNVSGKDVSRIKIRGDSVQIELSPEALKKYKSNSAALEKWGSKMEAPAERSPKPYRRAKSGKAPNHKRPQGSPEGLLAHVLEIALA